MRILVLSDLLLPTVLSTNPAVFYEKHPDGMKFMFIETGKSPSFFPLYNFTELIDNTQPDLVLIAGDMLADEDKSQNIRFNALLSFLNYINMKEIQCFFIQGNHDIKSYDKLVERVKSLEYIKDITDKMIEWRGKLFLGLSHAFTYSLKNCRNIKNLYPEKIDFILGHVLEQRRIWLFDLDAEFIFSGHFGNSITCIENKFLIAIDWSSSYYFILDYGEQECVLEFYYQNTNGIRTTSNVKLKAKYYRPNPQRITKLVKQDETIIWYKDNLKLKSSKFTKRLKSLYKAKKKFLTGSISTQEKIVSELLKKGIPKVWIFEYLNWKFLQCKICGKRFHNKSGLNYHLSTHK